MSNDLEQFIETVQGENHLRIEHDYGDGFVRLRTSEAERRQAAQDIQRCEDIVIEALRNSRDAHAHSIFLASSCIDNKRIINIVDDGDGIPSSMHNQIFEPRVTSKLDTAHMDKWGMHGRGMALFSIASNTDVARVTASDTHLGSSIVFEVKTSKLTERKDQSTFPTFTIDENKTVNVRGPRNIVRTTCEFAIESTQFCDVYFGSQTDILATLYAYGKATLTDTQRLFSSDVEQIPVCKRLACATDITHFAELASDLGFVISERTARRIMDGTISPVEPITNQIAAALSDSSKPSPAPKQTCDESKYLGRSIRFNKQDLDLFKDKTAESFSSLAEKYYLADDVEIRTRVEQDTLVVRIPLVIDDEK